MKNTNSYDQLFGIIDGCVKRISYQQMQHNKNMIVVSVIEETRFQKFIEGLTERNPHISLTIIAQDYMENAFRDTYGDRYRVVGWKGRYTTDIINKLSGEMDITSIDGFAFFTDLPINLRDNNFMQIAELIQNMGNVNIYSSTIGNDLYEYRNISLYRQALRLFVEINKTIDLFLNKDEQGGGI